MLGRGTNVVGWDAAVGMRVVRVGFGGWNGGRHNLTFVSLFFESLLNLRAWLASWLMHTGVSMGVVRARGVLFSFL